MLIQKYLRVWYFPLGEVVLHAIREGLRLIRNVKCLPTGMFSLQKKKKSQSSSHEYVFAAQNYSHLRIAFILPPRQKLTSSAR